MAPKMKTDSAVILGTPAVGSVVFGASMYLMRAELVGLGLIVGWAVGHVALNALLHPELKAVRSFSSDVNKPQHTTFIMPEVDGFNARIASDIPFSDWQAVGQAVVMLNSKRLNMSVVDAAFPNLAQAEKRALRNRIEGLLKPEHVGILVVKGNGHAEITYPVGWQFFARVSKGMMSPLIINHIPHTPPERKSLQKMIFTQHTHATQGILQEFG